MEIKATPKQIAFIKTLSAERVSPTGTWLWEEDESILTEASLDLAKVWISKMLTLPRAQRQLFDTPIPDKKKPCEGIHEVDGSIIKVVVAVHGSGHLYAKRFDPETKKFVKASGVLSRISEDTLVSLEKAQDFGKLYGVCIRCGRTLTDEDSIAAGIGPICAQAMA